MNIFKSFTLLWWQLGLFKLSLVSLGILLGAYWSGFFKKYVWFWIILFIVSALYIAYVWFAQ